MSWMDTLPGCGWDTVVVSFHTLSHLIHPGAAVMTVASINKPGVFTDLGLNIEACGAVTQTFNIILFLGHSFFFVTESFDYNCLY